MFQLPEYEPSDEVWKRIEAGLNNDFMQKAISQLPEYEPDEEIWSNINRELNQKKPKLIVWKWASIAASVLLIAGILIYTKPWNTTDISYSQEKIEKQLLLSSTDDSQKQYEMIMAYCKEQTYVCQNPEFKELKSELEDLNDASIQLKEAVGNYNTEPELMAQLSTIEQQKADVIRKMAMKI
ncbi:hypothetical protein [Emticicia sp. BO119]|uniref:hypothetical protein n=1 Tax=Emticicia sp. BO119 TaxID=2757768 RepID=UPI0015F0B38F|nr:hypothetical protein [Emticicia sp. BO119]MBA4853125.1 hypothetical protein [Emticicia sp. BO119]